MDYIRIDNDHWDSNKVWVLLEYNPRPDSTGVHLILEDPDTKETASRVVASHQIEWLEAKDY